MKGEYSAMPDAAVAHYHLPGLFEFYDFYRAFLPLYFGAADGSGPGTAIPGTFWL